MVEINHKLNYPRTFLYKDGHLVGTILNYIQFEDVLLQIQKNKEKGYSIEYNGKMIRIDINGTLEDYTIGLYDQHLDILAYRIVMR